MESHVVEEVEVNEADVRRAERVARSGKDWTVAFPRLSQIRAEFQGEGQEIFVRFSKTEEAPVRFVAADDPIDCKTDANPQCMHEFVFGSQKHKRYSDTAIEKLRTVLKTADLDETHQMELETRRNRRHR
jgi:hypothetical protein